MSKGSILNVLAALALLLACNKQPETISVTGITLNPTSAELTEGETLTITAPVSPSDAANKTVQWSSSNPDIQVSNGTVTTSFKPGAATTSVGGRLVLGKGTITATTEDGLRVEKRFADVASVADKPEAALEGLRRQLGKHTGPYAFTVVSVIADPVRFYPASFLNGIRRELADELKRLAEARRPRPLPHTPQPGAAAHNVSTLDVPDVLLRSRCCIRWELGRCPASPRSRPAALPAVSAAPLYLVNQGNRLKLTFDCVHCEMVLSACNGSN